MPIIKLVLAISALVATVVAATGNCPMWVPIMALGVFALCDCAPGTK